MSGYYNRPWQWEHIRRNSGFIVQCPCTTCHGVCESLLCGCAVGSTDDPFIPVCPGTIVSAFSVVRLSNIAWSTDLSDRRASMLQIAEMRHVAEQLRSEYTEFCDRKYAALFACTCGRFVANVRVWLQSLHGGNDAGGCGCYRGQERSVHCCF